MRTGPNSGTYADYELRYPFNVEVYQKGARYFAVYGEPNKGQVIMNNTNAQTVLQAAFNQAGKIYVKDATYPTTSALTVPSNTEIHFESWNALIQGAGGHVLLKNADATNSNIKVLGGAFDGQSGTPTTDGNITFDGVTNCEVSGCKVINSPSEGIKFRSGSYSIATNNYVNTTMLSGGTGKAGIIAATDSVGAVLCNNIVIDAGGEALGSYYNTGYVNISDNVCRIVSAGRGDILVEGTTTSSQQAEQIIVTGNNILSDYYGIHIMTCEGFVVANNSIRQVGTTNGLQGIDIEGACKYGVISGNVLRNISMDGIKVEDTSSYISVIGNTIINPSLKTDNTYHGVLVEPAGGNQTQIAVVGNVVVDDQGGSATMASGIAFVAGANVITDYMAIGNIIEGQQTTGISVSGSATGFVRNNQGFVTENSGTGTINSGATSATITHGCGYTPAAADICVTLTENPTNTPGAIWVDTIGATTFAVNCENDPGASNLDFSWSVRRV